MRPGLRPSGAVILCALLAAGTTATRAGAQPAAATAVAAANAQPAAGDGLRTLILVRHGVYDEDDARDAEVGKALLPEGRE